MPQFFPEGANSLNLSRAQTSASITVPEEDGFDTPAFQGSMQQILSENLGQFVTVDFAMGTNTFQRRAGILYAVGRSFLVLFNETYQSFNIIDMFSVKTVSFFGHEKPFWMNDETLNSPFGVFGPWSGGMDNAIPDPAAAVTPPQPTKMQMQNNPRNYRSMSNR